jgi:hypothetical protein
MFSAAKPFLVAAFFASAACLMGCGVEELPVDEPQLQEEVTGPERSAMSTCGTSSDCTASPDALCCEGGGGTWACYGWSIQCGANNSCPTGYRCETVKQRCYSWYGNCK